MSIGMKFRRPVRTGIGGTAMAFSLFGAAFLIYKASIAGTAWHIVSFSVYGVSLVALWTMSTLYHSLNVSDAARKHLEQIDHAMIYFLIAGTYTPICLVVLKGGWGWSLFGVNWALAAGGMALKLVFHRPPKIVTAVLFTFYILMGWLVVIAWFPLSHALSERAVFWLVLGGIFYTAGAGILNIKGKDILPGFGTHEIWHLCVFAGGFCHFWLMLKYVLYL